MSKVSICTVTLNRLALAKQSLGPALEMAGYPYELLSFDNGSWDGVYAYVEGLSPVWHYRSVCNVGYTPALNQMLLHASGEYLCILDPDIRLTVGWLARLVAANQAISDSGMSGYHCVLGLVSAAEIINGCRVNVQEEIHGVKFYHRRVLEKVGYYCEDFVRYGNEDVEMNRRIKMAGFKSYYLAGPDDKSAHLGEDSSSTEPYRMQKWADLRASAAVLSARFQYLEATGDYYLPPPALI